MAQSNAPGAGCGKKGWPEPCTFVLPGTLRSQRFTWPWLQLRLHFRPFHGHLYHFRRTEEPRPERTSPI